jgi:CheY-like chemotaxis protein
MSINATGVQTVPPTSHSNLREVDWPRILFVDDNPNVVAAMERNFHLYKVRLTRAYHGMQGIMSAVNEKPNVIITDISMPLASGDELIECIATHPSTLNTPIIILTGRSAVAMTSRLKRLNVVAVLHKPLNFEHLICELQRLVHIAKR